MLGRTFERYTGRNRVRSIDMATKCITSVLTTGIDGIIEPTEVETPIDTS